MSRSRGTKTDNRSNITNIGYDSVSHFKMKICSSSLPSLTSHP